MAYSEASVASWLRRAQLCVLCPTSIHAEEAHCVFGRVWLAVCKTLGKEMGASEPVSSNLSCSHPNSTRSPATRQHA